MRENKFIKYFSNDQAGANVSWGAIFAGIVTFFALFLTGTLVGSAIGFGIVQPTAKDPFSGLGIGLILWTIGIFLISFFCSGFIAGITSRKVGIVHGFLTWASSILLLVIILSYTTIGTLSVVKSSLSSLGSITGNGITEVASVGAKTVSKAFDEATKNIASVDTTNLQNQVSKILSDTDVVELQPDYLEKQLTEATDEVTEAGKEIIKDPAKAEEFYKTTLDSLKERTKNIVKSVDRTAIANAISSNTELSKEEAEQSTDNIYNELQKVSKQTENQLKLLEENLDKAKSSLSKSISEMKETAEETSNLLSKVSMYVFVALILAMIITSIAGLIGSNIASIE